MRVSSSNTRATRPDRHINGFKGLKLVNVSHSSPCFPKSSSYSQFLPFADPTADVYPSPIVVVDICLSIVDLCLFVVDLCSSSATSLICALRLHLSDSTFLFHLLGSVICGFVDLLFGFLFFGCVDLFFGFVDLLFGFVDLLILFFRNQTTEV